MNLAEMLATAAEQAKTPRISPIGQIARLREAAEFYDSVDSFDVGQLVTPRKDCSIRGHGDPHLVVEINGYTEALFCGEPASNYFGARAQIRVMAFTESGSIACWWVEAWQLEPYRGDGADVETESPCAEAAR